MGLPLFRADGDPGPSFWHYAESAGLNRPPGRSSRDTPHATTVIAVRYRRRASSWWATARRRATTSPVATCERSSRPTTSRRSPSRAAPRAGIEVLKIAQLSFEHYEKMTDSALSLEGKANYLSPIIQRNNLSSPLIVVPLLAGWDDESPAGPDLRVRRGGRVLRALRLRDHRLGFTVRRGRVAAGLSREPRA